MGKKKRRAAQEEAPDQSPQDGKLRRKEYEAKLDELHMGLVKMQYWIKAAGKKLVVLFEGRDTAGKGGAIKCVGEPLNPRGCRIVALGKPSDTEKTQWYFQRYVAHLPAAGEIVLYDAVGRDYDWTSRRMLSDDELAALLHDPKVEVHVLLADGVPAGFAELHRRIEGEIELVQFGLMPEFIGQGLGRYFLQWAIDKAWSYGPKRFWLHTCTKDHPAALPNYSKAGFVVYREEVEDQG